MKTGPHIPGNITRATDARYALAKWSLHREMMAPEDHRPFFRMRFKLHGAIAARPAMAPTLQRLSFTHSANPAFLALLENLTK